MLLPTGGEGEGWVEGKGGGVDGFAGGGEEGEGLGQEEGHPSLHGECKKERKIKVYSFCLGGNWGGCEGVQGKGSGVEGEEGSVGEEGAHFNCNF